MPTSNPTGTIAIEKAWMAEIRKRFNALTREYSRILREVSGMPNAERRVMLNKAFLFDEQQALRLAAVLSSRVTQLIVGPPPDWQRKYILQSYLAGLQRTTESIARQGVDLGLIGQIELSRTDELLALTATPSLGLGAAGITLGTASTLAPIHQSALEFLYTRAFDSLQNIDADMSRSLQQILNESASQGWGIRKTAKEINTTIRLGPNQRGVAGENRAFLIARTENAQAFQRAAANKVDEVNVGRGKDEEIMLKWVDAGDSKVRTLHAGWDGDIMDSQEARRRIAVNPFNCRCALVPVVPGFEPLKKKRAA